MPPDLAGRLAGRLAAANQRLPPVLCRRGRKADSPAWTGSPHRRPRGCPFRRGARWGGSVPLRARRGGRNRDCNPRPARTLRRLLAMNGLHALMSIASPDRRQNPRRGRGDGSGGDRLSRRRRFLARSGQPLGKHECGNDHQNHFGAQPPPGKPLRLFGAATVGGRKDAGQIGVQPRLSKGDHPLHSFRHTRIVVVRRDVTSRSAGGPSCAGTHWHG